MVTGRDRRDGFPPGVPCWIDSARADPEAAAVFYGGLFGWEFEDRMPAGSSGRYLVARLGGRDAAAIGSLPPGSPSDPVWSTYICVDDAEGAATRVLDAGGSVLVEPFDVLDAGRMGIFADPSGAVFNVWQPGVHKGAQVVNTPGSWNWSILDTPDLEGARAFYHGVFGWEADPVHSDEGSYALVRLPGYGDFLEAYDPELRARQSGAPSGFEDAVAWMVPIDPSVEAPRWSVTFAVDDTDAAVARAERLGGSVVVPPFDVPPVRTALLGDPQGAVFTVSCFDPSQL